MTTTALLEISELSIQELCPACDCEIVLVASPGADQVELACGCGTVPSER